MKHPFQFATIELMPYPELGEFVIVGVLAVASDRYLSAQILPTKNISRLTHFFPEIDRTVFNNTLRDLRAEFTAITKSVNPEYRDVPPLDLPGAAGGGLFHLLTTPREGTVRVRHRGTGLTENLDGWVKDAYDRFVLRTSTNETEAAERTLTNQVRSLLSRWHLAKLYRPTQVGNRHYHTTFPLAYTPKGATLPQRVIKPLHLGQSTPTKIIDHGDAWLQKIRRLRQFNHAPELIIFPIQRPSESDPDAAPHREAAEYLANDFRQNEIQVIEFEDITALRNSVYVQPGHEGGLL